MTVAKLNEAIREARRFIKRGEVCLKAIPQRDYVVVDILASKESGACRRASMDLTRVLAELRKWS
jgi:hypothetical protein